MNPGPAAVVANQEHAPGIFRLKLRAPSNLAEPQPGQFFMLKVGRDHDPLLRRPLSYLSVTRGPDGSRSLEFLYQVRGRGTRVLARVRADDEVSLIGPLGSGWRMDPRPKRVIMVAGGIGAVPLFAQAALLARGRSSDSIDFIYGARTGPDLALAEELKAMIARVQLWTEDGTVGARGLATQGLSDLLGDRVVAPEAVILACGPRALLKAVAGTARERGIPCQVSLEARMACGMGACLTCSIAGASGTRVRVCKEGPVFDARAIDWEALDESA